MKRGAAVRRGGAVRRSIMPGAVIVALAPALLWVLAACEDPVGTLFGLDRPGDLTATTGEYPDRIEVTWSAVSDREDEDGNTVPVSHYMVERDPPFGPFANPEKVEATTFVDTPVSPGKTHTYRVYAVFSGNGETSDTSLPVTGYALITTTLQVYSEPNRDKGARSYPLASSVNDDTWFDVAGQAGWDYRLEINLNAGITGLDLYRKGDIETEITSYTDLDTGEAQENARVYRLPETGLYHVKLSGGSGTFSVSHR